MEILSEKLENEILHFDSQGRNIFYVFRISKVR